MIRVYRLLHRMVKSSAAAAAKYLPSTAEASDTGAVSSSWSVRFCRSSQIRRMVKSGHSSMFKSVSWDRKDRRSPDRFFRLER